MKTNEAYTRLSGELARLGLRGELSRKIAANLSGTLADTITNFQRGDPMSAELMGSVSISEIQARINAAYPKYSKMDYGIYMATATVIRNHPDWTADQVFAEVEKSVKPASAGGNLVIPKALQDRRAQAIMAGLVAIGGIFVLSFISRKRETAD